MEEERNQLYLPDLKSDNSNSKWLFVSNGLTSSKIKEREKVNMYNSQLTQYQS
jgi:hypothetical protein